MIRTNYGIARKIFTIATERAWNKVRNKERKTRKWEEEKKEKQITKEH